MEAAEKTYYTAEDVKSLLGVKTCKAYAIIRQLNDELTNKGYITVQGKISAKYFNERVYIN